MLSTDVRAAAEMSAHSCRVWQTLAPPSRDSVLASRLQITVFGSVCEAGCGAGAGLLCLAARVPGVYGLGLEREEALAGLAAQNFAANGFESLRAERADVTDWRSEASFDHAMANPPGSKSSRKPMMPRE